MRLHPRARHVGRVGELIRSALLHLQAEHRLTDTEMLQMLLDVAHGTSKWLLRTERHPGNPRCRAHEACNVDCYHGAWVEDGDGPPIIRSGSS